MARLLIIPLLLIFCSCAALYQPPKLHEGGGIKVKYEEQIKDWQERLQKEKWSENLVDEIIKTSQVFAKYTNDKNPDYRWKNDYWFTPQEMINADFNGDCEDIGSLIFGTFKKLNYPYGVRLLIVETLQFSDHLLVRVELPDGGSVQHNSIESSTWSRCVPASRHPSLQAYKIVQLANKVKYMVLGFL